VTAQLTNIRTGEHVWAQRFDEDGADVIGVQEAVADKIYDSVAGLEGWIRKEEERSAWRKTSTSLDEYDYYLRGHAYFFRGTCGDTMRARRIWEDGLRRFPNSALLRIKIAFTYTNGVENYCSTDPSGDIERAWALGREASANVDNSALATWLSHWLMAVLYQWHDQDFERSIGEAELAARLAPYDARSRAEMAFYLANAGKLDQAAEWSARATRGPSAKYGYQNLAWAYYLMGKYQDALTALNKSDSTLPGYQQQLATTYVRLGRIVEAQSVMREWMQTKPNDSVSFEASWPMKDEFKAAYIADLRLAGMPD
jgi:tetratricopeptide (TPR) repeat protein